MSYSRIPKIHPKSYFYKCSFLLLFGSPSNTALYKRYNMAKLLLILLICIISTHITSGFTYREINAKSNREQQHIKKSSIDYPSDIIDGKVELPLSVPYIQWSASRRGVFNRRYCCIVLKATSDDGSDKGGGKKGYRFGDFTKGITKSLIGDKVEKVCLLLLCRLQIYTYIDTNRSIS